MLALGIIPTYPVLKKIIHHVQRSLYSLTFAVCLLSYPDFCNGQMR